MSPPKVAFFHPLNTLHTPLIYFELSLMNKINSKRRGRNPALPIIFFLTANPYKMNLQEEKSDENIMLQIFTAFCKKVLPD